MVLCSACTDTMIIFVKKLSILNIYVNLPSMCEITGRAGKKGSGKVERRLIGSPKVSKGEGSRLARVRGGASHILST